MRVLTRSVVAALLISLATVVAIVPLAERAHAQSVVSVSLFFENLAPHGRWFLHPRWGWVWFPTAINPDWRPYTRGQWIWTAEYGWYWEAEEPWGWAVYHYGRWAYDEEYGWVWVPGTVWGPAWVAFRYSDAYIGWAPLPPETLYVSAPVYSVAYTEMSAVYYRPRWVFVQARYFIAPRVYAYAAPPTNNYIYINRTVNVTNYVTVNRVVVNRSIEPRRIQVVVGRPIVPVRVHNVTNGTNVTLQRNQTTQIKVVNVYRPVVKATPSATPPPAARAQTDDKPRVAVYRDAVAPSERRRIDHNASKGTSGPKSSTPPQPVATTPNTAPSNLRPQPFTGTTPKPASRDSEHKHPPGDTTPKPTEKYAPPKPNEKYVAPKPSPDFTPKQPPGYATPPVEPTAKHPPIYNASKRTTPDIGTQPRYVAPAPVARPRPPTHASPPASQATSAGPKPHPQPNGKAPPCGQPGQPPCPPR